MLEYATSMMNYWIDNNRIAYGVNEIIRFWYGCGTPGHKREEETFLHFIASY